MAEPDPQVPPAPEPDAAPEAAAEPVGLISTAAVLAAQPARANPAAGPEAHPGEPLEAGRKGKGKAMVRTQHPVDRFEHAVDGVAPITSAGVEIDLGKVDDLLAAAASAGTTLEVVS